MSLSAFGLPCPVFVKFARQERANQNTAEHRCQCRSLVLLRLCLLIVLPAMHSFASFVTFTLCIICRWIELLSLLFRICNNFACFTYCTCCMYSECCHYCACDDCSTSVFTISDDCEHTLMQLSHATANEVRAHNDKLMNAHHGRSRLNNEKQHMVKIYHT